MFLRPRTPLALWVSCAICWAAGTFLGLFFHIVNDQLLLLGLPLVAVLLLLPLAFIGTWAANDAEFPHWGKGRILLHWVVVPGATLSTIVVAVPLAALVLASQFVALTLFTGLWLARRGVPRAMIAPR